MADELPFLAKLLLNGAKCRRHKATGMWVYMDKSDPGIYYDAHGRKVTQALARECGFEVEHYSKQRRKKDFMTAAQDQIDKELALSNVYKRDVVLEEKGGYKLVDAKMGRAVVKDAEGNLLTALPLDLKVAKALFDNLTVEEEPEPIVVEEPAKKSGVRSMA